jgi:DNA primase
MNADFSAPDRSALIRANQEAAGYFRSKLLSEAGTRPRHYLTARGFGAVLGETVWTVGYAPPGWTRLLDHLRRHRFDDRVLLDAGLVSRTRTGHLIDRFRDRLTFGITAEEGELVGFTARSAPHVAQEVPK